MSREVVNQQAGDWELEEKDRYIDVSLGQECPPGLEALKDLRQMVLIQQVEDKEVWWSRNMYRVEDGNGHPRFNVIEDKSQHPIVRALLSSARPFRLVVTDVETGAPVLEMTRPLACPCPMICPFERQAITVRQMKGEVLGQVQHSSRESCRSWCDPSEYYFILNHEGKVLYNVEGESCYPCEIFNAAPFTIVKPDNGMRIGQIGHQWRGACGLSSCCVSGDPDKAYITFPMEIGVQTKALMMATLILAHFNYFESL